MKLTYLDKFADFLLSIPIIESASERGEKISQIRNLRNTLNLHLLKLYLFQNSTHRSHWKDEIENWLNDINKYYWGQKQKFEKDDYFQWLFNDFCYDKNNNIDHKSLKREISKLLNQYKSESIEIYTTDEFVNISNFFYDKICTLLENDYDYEKIYNLINQYFDLNHPDK